MRAVLTLLCAAAMVMPPFASVAQVKSAPAHKSAQAAAPAKSVPNVAPKPLLPDAFAGWVAEQKPQSIADAEQADSANAAALKEYGLLGGMSATYKRDDGTLTLKALRFGDVSGAYGAYSFYRQNGWPKEEIGNGATSNHNRVLFWKGTTVVDATFSHISPESGSELRELANELPAVQGAKALAPPILGTLPKKSLEPQTMHFALGPAGYVGSGGALPPQLVGFDRDAEAVTATYGLASGPAVLTLINYPTPQMAMAQEMKIRDYLKAGKQAQPPFPQPLIDSDQASLEVRRSGPVVAVVSGDAVPEESHRLLNSVHYESEFVSIPQPGESEVNKTGRLLMGIAALVIIGSIAAIMLGFFLGGGRALYRIAKGKPASSVYESEFIRLDLRE